MMIKLLAALPKARRWVDQQVATHWSSSTPVSEFDFDRLSQFFPRELLSNTRVAVVDRTPAPPLEQWGVGEFNDLGAPVGKSAAGITLGRLFFVRRGREQSESLFFHEMVHVVQWDLLGANGFLALYGILLRKYGYQGSPLEEMAYQLQSQFVDQTEKPFQAVAAIEKYTDEIVAKFVGESWTNRLVLSVVRRLIPGRLSNPVEPLG